MSVIVAAEQSFGSLGRQMSKFIDQLNKGYNNFAPGETWNPNVNLYETETAYLVCVDLAGVDKDKIEITVDENVLKLRGHRAVPSMADGNEGDLAHRRVKIHLMEIDHGSFSREVELPMNVQHEKIAARHHNGLLWVELPKKED